MVLYTNYMPSTPRFIPSSRSSKLQTCISYYPFDISIYMPHRHLKINKSQNQLFPPRNLVLFQASLSDYTAPPYALSLAPESTSTVSSAVRPTSIAKLQLLNIYHVHLFLHYLATLSPPHSTIPPYLD